MGFCILETCEWSKSLQKGETLGVGVEVSRILNHPFNKISFFSDVSMMFDQKSNWTTDSFSRLDGWNEEIHFQGDNPSVVRYGNSKLMSNWPGKETVG